MRIQYLCLDSLHIRLLNVTSHIFLSVIWDVIFSYIDLFFILDFLYWINYRPRHFADLISFSAHVCFVSQCYAGINPSLLGRKPITPSPKPSHPLNSDTNFTAAFR